MGAEILSGPYGFALVAAVLALTPGFDMLFVIRCASVSGVRAGVSATAGISTGSFLWAVGSAIGVIAVIDSLTTMTGAPVFDLILFVGIGYMAWIGIADVRAGRRAAAVKVVKDEDGSGLSAKRAIRDGFVVNLLNPKIGLFYVMVVPQFIVGQTNVLLQFISLGLIHIIMGTVVLVCCALAAGRLRRLMTSGRARGRMLIASGIFIQLIAVVLLIQRLGA